MIESNTFTRPVTRGVRFLLNDVEVNMKTATLFLLILATIIFSSFADAFACTCDLPLRNLSLKQQVNAALKNSKAVFSGQVLEITANPDNHYLVAKLKVEKSWKSIRTEEVSIVTGRGGGDCGFHFTIGETYLVYAYGTDDNKLGTNICQRTAKITEAAEDIKLLGKGKAPNKPKA